MKPKQQNVQDTVPNLGRLTVEQLDHTANYKAMTRSEVVREAVAEKAQPEQTPTWSGKGDFFVKLTPPQMRFLLETADFRGLEIPRFAANGKPFEEADHLWFPADDADRDKNLHALIQLLMAFTDGKRVTTGNYTRMADNILQRIRKAIEEAKAPSKFDQLMERLEDPACPKPDETEGFALAAQIAKSVEEPR